MFVENMFDTFKLKFFERATFNLAIHILERCNFEGLFNGEHGLIDIGHADMIITFEKKNIMNHFVRDFAIHQNKDIPNFKVAEDFTIF
jgi:hypothetical protein